MTLIGNDLRKHKFDVTLLSQLLKEIDNDFIMTHKEFTFDMKLPFSGDKYADIAKVLPKGKFVRILDRTLDHRAIVAIERRSIPFIDALK